VIIKQQFAQSNPFDLLRYSLSNKQISCLYFTENLAHLLHLDLSGNQLIRFGRNFNSLLSLQSLILDSNHIESIEKNVELPHLNKLYLQNNRKSLFSQENSFWHFIQTLSYKYDSYFVRPIVGIKVTSFVTHLKQCGRLEHVFLFGNALNEAEVTEQKPDHVTVHFEQVDASIAS
jgi:Leucine-rich repeat (LRR) protein